MKRLYLGISSLVLALGLFSCIKEEETLFTDTLVEFDAAVMNTNNAYTPSKDTILGRIPDANKLDSIAFPFLVRQPPIGRAAAAADPAITRTSGNVRLRINLVGATRRTATTVNIAKVPQSGYTLIGLATNLNPNAEAVEGTHYGPLPTTVTIPADSSFGYLDIPILNTGMASTVARELALRITGATEARPNRNYSYIGIRISQQ
ncbi:hypothetical protein [Flaviaesturariibacter amylovorans]|uniref:DUF4843 domain-containing protein n=1 Tax=Flaviaesturariibacter amylovorans TaxID=1084520 RepID=A0ABP8GA72_9BACT